MATTTTTRWGVCACREVSGVCVSKSRISRAPPPPPPPASAAAAAAYPVSRSCCSLSFVHRSGINNGYGVCTNLSHPSRRRWWVVRAASDDTPLTMLFQAEGTMKKAAIPTVTDALKGMEGIDNLKVQLIEGIASVELTKETTLLATGTASDLVEIIQGSGFKLQTLKLSFEDKEDIYWNLG